MISNLRVTAIAVAAVALGGAAGGLVAGPWTRALFPLIRPAGAPR